MTASPSPATARDVLTIQELAERLGMGLTRTYEMARTNSLPIPALRIGREYRFSRRALERWLESDHAADADTAA